jgi:hypothetical protein
VEHRAITNFCQRTLFFAICLASFQDTFCSCSSVKIVLLQVILGLPFILSSCGSQSCPCLVMLFWSFLEVCPIHFHFLIYISLSTGICCVVSHSSLFVMVFGGHNQQSINIINSELVQVTLIVNLCPRQRWVISLTTLSLYLQGKSSQYRSDSRLGGPQRRSGQDGREKSTKPLPVIKPRSSSLFIALTDWSILAHYNIIISTFSVSSVLRHSPSARCVIDANNICRLLDIFIKTISPLRILHRYVKLFRLIYVLSLVLSSYMFA